MKKIIALFSLLLLAAGQLSAQDSAAAPKFRVDPIGRVLIDGALYASPQKEMFRDGMSIPDVRLGAKMSYGNWSARVDVGYAYGKVGLKDLYIQYNFNDRNLVRVGSFIHHYGLQSATSASNKVTVIEPVSNTVFNDPRLLGAMYEYSGDRFLAMASAHVEPSSTTVMLRPNQFLQEGYGFRTRLVARPLHREGLIAQAGISGAFGTPERTGDPDSHDAFTFKSNFPTQVAQVTALEAKVTHAMNQWKFTPELLLAYGPVALESQYYFNRVNRRNGLHAFTGQGAYAIVRGLITGGSYRYNMQEGCIATPGPRSLEAVAEYNYTDICDSRAAIFGGRLNNASLTFTYYINKYFMARLHYNYTHTWGRRDVDGTPVGPVSLNGFMARLQVIF